MRYFGSDAAFSLCWSSTINLIYVFLMVMESWAWNPDHSCCEATVPTTEPWMKSHRQSVIFTVMIVSTMKAKLLLYFYIHGGRRSILYYYIQLYWVQHNETCSMHFCTDRGATKTKQLHPLHHKSWLNITVHLYHIVIMIFWISIYNNMD